MSLTEEQYTSIENPDESKLIVALPGAGKTHTSMELAKRILESGSNNYLLIVTFTNAATAEIRKRLERSLPGQLLAKVRVSTFASIMLEQAKTLLGGRKLALGVEQEGYANRALYSNDTLSALLAACGLPVSKTKKGRVFEPDDPDYRALRAELPQIFASLCREYPETEGAGPAYKAYEQYKVLLEQYKRVDLDGLSKELINALLAENIEPLPFTHIIVDEFQDTDYLQYFWLLIHQQAGSYIAVVGDDDQSIYGWRGAKGIENMANLVRECGAKQYALQTCFRCAPEVLEAAGRVIANNKQRIPKEMRSQASSGGSVKIKEFTKAELIPLMDEDDIEELMANQFGPSWRDEGVKATDVELPPSKTPEAAPLIAELLSQEPQGWAILARSNASLDLLEAEFSARGVSVVRLGGKSIWENKDTMGLLSLMYGLCYGNDPSIFLAGLAWSGETEDNLVQIQREMKRHKDFSMVASTDTAWSPITVSLNEIASDFKNWSGETGFKVIREQFSTAILQGWQDSNSKPRVEKKLSWLLDNVLQSYRGTMRERMTAIMKATRKKDSSAQTSNPDGVVLSTMSSSKGLEWPNVWIADVEPVRSPAKITLKQFKQQAEEADDPDLMARIEEERRLLYVAMTRAERNLVLSYRHGRASPFIEECQF